MNTSFILCNCYELDNDYNHTVNFTSKDTQLNWFVSKQVHRLNNNMYQRKTENIIRVDLPLKELKSCNYMVALNFDEGSRYYYFIVNKEYVNDYTTTLYLQLDLIQTYLFDINFSKCLVDRQHINRWTTYSNGLKEPNVYYSQEDEGLELGEYQIEKITTIYDYSNKGSYIITSSEPLGILNDTTSSSSSSRYMEGYIDKNGLKMIKSFEGFASEPYNLGDGTLTTGYGCTSEYTTDAYNSLLPTCTEEEASIVLGNWVFSEFSLPIKAQLDSDGYNWDYMTQDLFNALVSFAWNSGAYAMRTNYYELWEMVLLGFNVNNPTVLQEQWSVTNIMEGSEWEEGLRNRRHMEGLMAIGQYDYNNFTIANITNGGVISTNDGYGYIPVEYL